MSYPSLRIEGNIISPDILTQLENEELNMGQRAADFGLPAGSKVKDEIAYSWAEAQEAYRRFKQRTERLQAKDAATSATRQAYMAPFFSFLGYDLQQHTSGLTVTGQNQTYPISHTASNRGHTPIYIIGYNDPAGLDRKPENATRRMSAHALIQEYLNLSESLYGIVTNGHVIRLLRDSSRLVKQSFLEFDLDRIFEDNLYADFALLYRILHATRLPVDAQRPADCLLERYHQDALASGARIREGLSQAVAQAIISFADGFLKHPDNHQLRALVRSNDLSAMEFYRLLLRLIYRLLFLMVVEERNLIFPVATSSADKNRLLHQQRIYEQGYSVRRLRTLAEKHLEGSNRHTDLWQSLISTFQLFAANSNGHQLGIMPLAGELFAPDAIGVLAQSTLSNDALLHCILHLSRYTPPQGAPMRVNYGALNVEEFGSVYEGLLGYTPHIDDTAGQMNFSFHELQGSDRKTSGSYYTPDSLVQAVLDSALNPVIARATHGKKPADAANAIRALRICEPAVGSGHFLLGAARRLAHALASAEAEAVGASEYAPSDYQAALRDVIEHCVYGVDINPMSAELCRVALWIEAHEPGKPLSFIDHHIQVGNSLLGTTPQLIQAGIPDEAFVALEGDDKQTVSELKRRNKGERRPLGPLFAQQDDQQRIELAQMAQRLNTLASNNVQLLVQQGNQYRAYLESPAYQQQKLIADAWCAAFVAVKHPMSTQFGRQAHGITTGVIQRLMQGAQIETTLQDEIVQLATQYQFFHWHIAFPDVMANGGFDCVLGNPPWERVKLQEKEWFAYRNRDIANATNAATRKRLIEQLAQSNPVVYHDFLNARRSAEGESHFLRASNVYPLCGRGDVNLYTVFTEKMHQLINSNGHMGCIIPSGIATDDTTKHFFADIVNNYALVSLFDFENRQGLFPDVDSRMKFCLFTARKQGTRKSPPTEYLFFAHDVADLTDPERRFTLSSHDISLLNPNTLTCPTFQTRKDAELVKSIYRRVSILIREIDGTTISPWGCSITRIFDMSRFSDRAVGQMSINNASTSRSAIMTTTDTVFIPVIESKMIWQYDHRFSTYENCNEYEISQGQTNKLTTGCKQNPNHFIKSRLYFDRDIANKYTEFNSVNYWVGYRNITNTTNERTTVACIYPRYTSDYSMRLIFGTHVKGILAASLICILNSFVFDYVARQSVGGTNFSDYIMKQLPVLTPEQLTSVVPYLATSIHTFILPRVLDLTYTAWDLRPFAHDCGYDGPPFRWDEERRMAMRSELDALMMHLYLPSTADGQWARDSHESDADYAALTTAFATPRAAVLHVLDSFPILKRRDEQLYGTYRTRDQILQVYDAMQSAYMSGSVYTSPIQPPPGLPVQADGRMVRYEDLRERPRHIHIDESRIDYAIDVVDVDDVRMLRNIPNQFRCRLRDGVVVSVQPIHHSQLTEGLNVIIIDRAQSTPHIGRLVSVSRQTDPDGHIVGLSLVFNLITGGVQIVSLTISDLIAYIYTESNV
jgi:hypothetical protein